MIASFRIVLALALSGAMTLVSADSGAWAAGAGDKGAGGGRGGSETQGGGDRPGSPGADGRDQKGGGRGEPSGRGKEGPRGTSSRSTGADSSADDARGGRPYRLIRSRPDLSPHDAALIAVQRQEALPLDQILRRMRSHSSGQVIDAMLVHDGAGLYYRLRVLERSGAVREMFLAAKSGELVAGR